MASAKTFLASLFEALPFQKEKFKNKFVIFASARTGSSALVQALRVHGGIQCHGEVFTPGKWEKFSKESWNSCHVENVRNTRDLEFALNGLFGQYDGFKHLQEMFDLEKNKALLTSFNLKVIFLWRKNALRRSISRSIAKQSSVSHLWQVGREKYSNYSFEPIDIEELKQDTRHYKELVKIYKNILLASRVNFFEITYEDLFGKDISLAEKIALINQVFKFLGCSLVQGKETLQKLGAVFDYQNKLNSESTYLKIPNIEAIRRELENNENGFLFG